MTKRTRKRTIHRPQQGTQPAEVDGAAKSNPEGDGDAALQQHVDQIRQLESTINTDDVAGRYLIGVEVAAIHAEDPTRGVRRAAQALARWSEKSLYEYQYVTETWDPARFERIRRDAGPAGNVLRWSDFVGLSYIADPEERERVRREALKRNLSVKTLRRKTPKSKTETTRKSEEGAPPSAPLPAALCRICNDLPPMVDVLKTVMALLGRPAQEEETKELRQLRIAVADELKAFQTVAAEAVLMLLPAPAAEPSPDGAGVPADQNDVEDVEFVPQSGTVVHRPAGTDDPPAEVAATAAAE
jgi:hypothetical protein